MQNSIHYLFELKKNDSVNSLTFKYSNIEMYNLLLTTEVEILFCLKMTDDKS